MNRRSDGRVVPGPGRSVHDEFVRSLTRERYGEALPARPLHATENGPTAQWNRHQALVELAEAEDLWQEEDEDEDS